MFNFFKLASKDIGIDLGTANILVNKPTTTNSSDSSKIPVGNIIANFAGNGGAVAITGGELNVGRFGDEEGNKKPGYICNNYALNGGAIYGKGNNAKINLTFGGI